MDVLKPWLNRGLLIALDVELEIMPNVDPVSLIWDVKYRGRQVP